MAKKKPSLQVVPSNVREFPRLRLIEPYIDQDTIKVLEEMLLLARSGALVGLAYVGMFKGRQYIADTAGEASRNPTFTRGMVTALDDRLKKMVHSE